MAVDPTKTKYHNLYWDIARAAAEMSTAIRSKVGCVIVAQSGMMAIGYNGMPAGYKFGNTCEFTDAATGELVTKPETIHAERNAIDKMTRQGVSTEGSVMFTTMAPCLECAKSIHGLGFKHVYYREVYRNDNGLEFLKRAGISITGY